MKRLTSFFVHKSSKRYEKGKTIVAQGTSVDFLYLILKGLVEYTFTDEEGTEHLIEVFAPGALLCLQAFFGRQLTSGSFIALTDVDAASVPTSEIRRLIKNEPGVAADFLEEMGRVVNGLVRQLQTSAASAKKRVGELLFILANASGNDQGGAKGAFIPLSQEDMGRIAKTSRVTVTKCLRELKSKNLIRTSYGGVRIEDMDGLREWLRQAG